MAFVLSYFVGIAGLDLIVFDCVDRFSWSSGVLVRSMVFLKCSCMPFVVSHNIGPIS